MIKNQGVLKNTKPTPLCKIVMVRRRMPSILLFVILFCAQTIFPLSAQAEYTPQEMTVIGEAVARNYLEELNHHSPQAQYNLLIFTDYWREEHLQRVQDLNVALQRYDSKIRIGASQQARMEWGLKRAIFSVPFFWLALVANSSFQFQDSPALIALGGTVAAVIGFGKYSAHSERRMNQSLAEAEVDFKPYRVIAENWDAFWSGFQREVPGAPESIEDKIKLIRKIRQSAATEGCATALNNPT